MAEILIAIVIGFAMIILGRYIPDNNKTTSFIKKYILSGFRNLLVISILVSLMSKHFAFDKRFVLMMLLTGILLSYNIWELAKAFLNDPSDKAVRKDTKELEDLRQQITDLRGEMGAIKAKKKKKKKSDRTPNW